MQASNHQELTYDQATSFLKCSTGMKDVNHYMNKGDIKSYMHHDAISGSIPHNSPFGSFLCLDFPFSKSPDLQTQFKKLNYN
jgi:hypothetical protein